MQSAPPAATVAIVTVHFFTFSDATGGSSRQRAFGVVDELNRRGVKAVIHQPPVLSISRTRWPKKAVLIFRVLKALFEIKKGDTIYLQRAIANKYFFVLILLYQFIFRRKIVFDFDDPVYVHSFWKTKIFTKMADVVIVCTHGQAEWARQYSDNVHIIHIALDFSVYEQYTKDYDTNVSPPYTIGWVGTGPEHLKNLKILADAFRELCVRTEAPFRFVLVGALKDERVYSMFQEITDLEVQFVDTLPWTESGSVPKEIQKFDIGVVPHQSSGEWNRSKSSFKVLEYMACGVATVASHFGEMSYIITDGENGFLATTQEEWVTKLDTLLSDRALQAHLGKNGQVRVRERYSYDAIIPQLVDILGLEEALKK